MKLHYNTPDSLQGTIDSGQVPPFAIIGGTLDTSGTFPKWVEGEQRVFKSNTRSAGIKKLVDCGGNFPAADFSELEFYQPLRFDTTDFTFWSSQAVKNYGDHYTVICKDTFNQGWRSPLLPSVIIGNKYYISQETKFSYGLIKSYALRCGTTPMSDPKSSNDTKDTGLSQRTDGMIDGIFTFESAGKYVGSKFSTQYTATKKEDGTYSYTLHNPPASSNGITLSFPILLDLTRLYGAGNEPSSTNTLLTNFGCQTKEEFLEKLIPLYTPSPVHCIVVGGDIWQIPEGLTFTPSGEGLNITGTGELGLAEFEISWMKSFKWIDARGCNVQPGIVRTDVPNRLLYFSPDSGVEGDQNVIVGGVCKNFVVTDGIALEIKGTFVAEKASYTRVNVTGTMGTLCLPYPIYTSDNIKLYRLKASASSSSPFAMYLVDSIAAGEPCVYKKRATTTDMYFTASNVNIEVEPITVTAKDADNIHIIGKFKKEVIGEENIAGAASDYYFVENSKFVQGNDYINANAFRAYVYIKSTS